MQKMMLFVDYFKNMNIIQNMSSMEKLLIYSVISGVITFIGLLVCKKKITEEKIKDKVLKITSLAVVFIHYSILWYDFLTTGEADAGGTMLFPIYPCNVIMWLLVIVAFNKNRESKVYRILADFCFYVGTFCGIIGIVINENFLNNPNFLDYDIFKGLLSHSVMVFGCMYLFIMGYIKVNALNNTISAVFGLLMFLCIGMLVNGLYSIFGLDPVNSMYLQELPFPELPFINTFTIGIGGVIIVFILSNIFESVYLEKENRVLNKIRKQINKRALKS